MGLVLSKNGGAVATESPVLVPSTIATANAGDKQEAKEDASVQLRHKQQRLILLYHGDKCQHDAAVVGARCSVTPHCQTMKDLWKHMATGCRSNSCGIRHCSSSRYILRHYRECQDEQCLICRPVRESIKQARRAASEASDDDASSVNAVDGRGLGSANMRRQGKYTYITPPRRSNTKKRLRGEQDKEDVQKRQRPPSA